MIGPNPSAPTSSSASAEAISTPSSQGRPKISAHTDSGSVFSPSSPIQIKSHPFLRKLQTGSNTNATAGSSAFSTSSSTGFPSDSSSNGRKSVDEAITAVASKSIAGSVASSPTTAAATATDALFSRRLNQSEDKTFDENNGVERATHAHDACCAKHAQGSAFDDTLFLGQPIHLPPISAEAHRFSEQLLGQNKAWAQKTEMERPGFFAKLEKQQKPQVLWIGCSDSRVPANQIVNLDPGEIFVHRNIANVVTHTDLNLLSVLEYAVDVLKVRHVIVCGHYGCGGVAASLTQKQFGIIDNWLRNIKDLYTIHRKKFEALPHGGKEQQDLLTELNVIQSALNVSHTSIIQKAWSRGEEVSIHGWCYRLSDGMIRNLGLCIEGPGNVEDVYHVQDIPKSDK
ncbi:carbonic anhydrase [Gamsiella multidivaricata]|uniref:carbonic anhydrase n=1 Tax=Gamsiella multidivaricata TaxID=101098 RepID=UPI00221FBCEF|nr:carbonic anhydrase [Gamsiella multidivaricata]KAG0368714.1 hypothetical protein BGZ54_001302 [Gamsiella multidivaricata]KAI7826534.1 carbonic anhydrase [Gamsiella multidivaricata]